MNSLAAAAMAVMPVKYSLLLMYEQYHCRHLPVYQFHGGAHTQSVCM